MKILSWNTRGIGDQSKQMTLKRLLQTLNPDIVLIQGTKRDSFDSNFIKLLWSSKEVDWTFIEACGKSGGMLIMWDESKLLVIETLKGGFTLLVKCISNCKCVRTYQLQGEIEFGQN